MMEMRVAFTAVFVLLVTQTLVDHVMSSTTLAQYNPFADVENHSLIYGPDHIQLALYKQRNWILLAMLRSECPSQAVQRRKREITSEVAETQLEIEKLMYSGLSKMPVQCRQTSSTVTSTSPTPTTSATSTTSPVPTTTSRPQPSECQSAVDLTESWRLDHNGGNGRNCDSTTMLENGRPWFRFSGAGGQKLLDKCPSPYSCGSNIGWWSDNAMPVQVGVEASVQVYGSFTAGCSEYTATVSVMRCSTGNSHDFIYKYTSSSRSCDNSFCGMKVN